MRYQVTLLLFPKGIPGLAARRLLPMLKPRKPEKFSYYLCGDVRQCSIVAMYYSPHGAQDTANPKQSLGHNKRDKLRLCL